MLKRKLFFVIIALCATFGLTQAAHAGDYEVAPNLRIGAVIHTEEKGEIEALWQKGGEDVTEAGDQVIWGYFYASPGDVAWGSPQNPDVFVKIWFDRSGRLDVNFFHVSVPDIEVWSDYPADGKADENGKLSTTRRYIRQYYGKNGQSGMEGNDEDGDPPPEFWYWPTGTPSAYPADMGILIAAIVETVEKGQVNAVWHEKGRDTTAAGHKVVWGYFYTSSEDVVWGSEDNPDLFVKIWFDASGRTDVNFFHVSVPDIEVYSDIPYDDLQVQAGTTIMDNRYIRHEYQIDTDCPVEEQNKFVYEMMKDKYLWYDKVPEVDYTAYASPEELLKDLVYKELDQWSYITTPEAHYTYFEEGKSIGLGFRLRFDENGDYRVAYVRPDSPADMAGMGRSDKILEISGRTTSEISDEGLWNEVIGENEVGVSVELKIEDSEGRVRTVNLEKDWIAIHAVLHYDMIEYAGSEIAYLVFNEFIENAEEELDAAFAYFKQEKLDTLIVDLRYNRGGEVSVAQYLASLIAGNQVNGEVFAKSVHNDKYSHWDDTIYFRDLENALNMDSVFFITASQTCSASELVINGLRPFIEVATVGDNTCGKPVAMYGHDFCEIHIAPIELKTVNALGEGDYFGGIVPECYSEDDITWDFGDVREDSLKTVLHYFDTGSCPEDVSDSERNAREIEFGEGGKMNGEF